MLTSDTSSKYLLRIKVDFAYKYLVKVSLFDSDNRIISPINKSNDLYLFQLKRGLYTARVEMNAEVKDKVITVKSDEEYIVSSNLSNNNTINIIEPPKQFSSALLSGENVKTYNSSHEYYTNPAVDFSKRDTFFFNGYNQTISDSSLFIFLRFPSIDKYNGMRSKWSRSFYQDFEIVNEDGERIIHFESKIGIEVNENDGWLAFNAKLPNGIYYLIYRGDEPRQIPIYVFKNWHTQFFMTLGNVPLFGSTRIFISRGREFNPKAETNKYIDILLDKLQNGDYSVDKELIEIAAYGKYDSPMLGLICSYVYFKSPETQSDHLFNIIKQNMQNVILKDNDESPDIRALNILAANHFAKSNYKKTAVKGTPMLRIGFEAIQNASLKDRRLISKNSINDFISETLFYDSPFNTFKPIPFYKSPKANSGIGEEMEVEFKIKKNFLKLIDFEDEFDNTDEAKSINPLKKDIFSISIKNYLNPNILSFIKSLDTNIESEKNWVRTSISDMLIKNDNVSINDISSQLNLSGNTLTRIFDDWKKNLKDKK